MAEYFPLQRYISNGIYTIRGTSMRRAAAGFGRSDASSRPTRISQRSCAINSKAECLIDGILETKIYIYRRLYYGSLAY